MNAEKSAAKNKLTLSVDKEVVEKAKGLGMNLSGIMEDVLRGFTFKPSKTDIDSVYSGYEDIFKLMKSSLRDYDASVVVAEDPIYDDKGHLFDEGKIYLLRDGTFWNEFSEVTFKDIREIPLYSFLSPPKILSYFVSALSNAKEKRQEKLGELELAKRILQAIINSSENQPK